MINIRINLNNVPGHINVNSIGQEIASALEQLTNQNTNVNVNVRDNNSTSPLGIYKTQEYLKVRDRL